MHAHAHSLDRLTPVGDRFAVAPLLSPVNVEEDERLQPGVALARTDAARDVVSVAQHALLTSFRRLALLHHVKVKACRKIRASRQY